MALVALVVLVVVGGLPDEKTDIYLCTKNLAARFITILAPSARFITFLAPKALFFSQF